MLACMGAEKEWEALETEHNNLFWRWTASVAISCAALEDAWEQNRFGIGVLCGSVCKSSSADVICPPGGEAVRTSVPWEICRLWSGICVFFLLWQIQKVANSPCADRDEEPICRRSQLCSMLQCKREGRENGLLIGSSSSMALPSMHFE